MRNLLVLAVIIFNFYDQIFAKGFSGLDDNHSHKNSFYESLAINGSLILDNADIRDTLIVNGSTTGKNLRCKNLKSNGSFEVNNFKAQNIEINCSFLGKNIEAEGNFELNGTAEIIEGKLNFIQGLATYIGLSNTIVKGNVFIRKPNSGSKSFNNIFSLSNNNSKQILELKKGSLIMGDVEFEEEGEIYIFQNSKIRGKIKNAKIIRKN